MYILLRSLLRAWWSWKMLQDTSIFIFRVGCSRPTWLSHNIKYLSLLLPDFKELGAPFDSERPNTYSRISQLIATYDSHLVGVEPESSLEIITNIYPLRIDLRIIPMCSYGIIIRRTEDGPSSYGWLRWDLDCRCSNILVSTTLALYDSCL